MKKLVVWFNPNKNEYYYRVVRGIFYERYDYVVGAVNNYGHIIVLVIDFNDLSTYLVNYSRDSIKTRTIRRLISFLKKIS